MQSFFLKALGTQWSITIDSSNEISQIKKDITTLVQEFESTYSRFKPRSLVSQYNSGKNSKLTPEFSQMLAFGKDLEKECAGFFTLSSGKYLGNIGYGSGDQNIDFGSFGKGWLIDKIVKKLEKNDFKHYLINGGGDIFASQKQSKLPWTAALEHPTANNTLIGTITLINSGLAGSSPFKRTWGNNTHLIDGTTQQATTTKRSVFVTGKNAAISDALATILSIVPQEMIEKLAHKYAVEYLYIESNKLTRSNNFMFQPI